MRGVGPAAELELELAPRLKVLTGDNGLGKSFLLDLVWWALTRTWAGLPAVPHGDQPRIVLAVWAWVEHCKAAQVLRTEPRKQMTLLIDEVELHLHPQWQRRILPAVLAAIKRLSPEIVVQIVVTTHAPLVLASVAVERALAVADAYMRGEIDRLPAGLDTREKIDAELRRVLAAGDPFWIHWITAEEIAS